MWRFFRLGIKSSTCSGNQAHFRAIGTTNANAECDDKTEEFSDTFLNKENVPSNCQEGLAAKATQEHQNFLRYNTHKQHSQGIPFNVGTNKLKSIDDSLSKIQWQQYLTQREKLFAPEEKKKDKKQPFHVQRDQNQSKNFVGKNFHTPDSHATKGEERFGSLSKVTRKFEYLPEDEEDVENPLKETYGERLPAQLYGRKILALCQERKLKEALDVLEVEMKIQHVTPNEYCYNILINACGKAGYTKKAFQLYNQLKQRGLKVQKFAYTGLFNACANTPFKAEGLELARSLRKELKDKEKSLPPISYHSMIKAFGHCGDIETSFEIADEMLDIRHPVTTETMNFLLQACITDKENGFRHALMVWRRMRALKITPCIYSYNLLLRCVKECQAGDPQLVSNLLEELHPSKHERQRKKKENDAEEHEVEAARGTEKRVLEEHLRRVRSAIRVERSEEKVEEKDHEYEQDTSSSSRRKEGEDHRRAFCQISEKNEAVRVNLAEDMELEIVSSVPISTEETEGGEVLPDVLARKFRPGKVASISSLQTRVDRLWLLGGVTYVTENMMKDRLTPTVTTFTYLLECLPPTLQAEEALLSTMESCEVVPDVIFCNKLIKRRAFRSLDQAKEVLEIMQRHRVLVDLITFGCLAVGCRKLWEIDTLFRDMDKAGFVPNEEIIDTLLKNCTTNREFGYSIELLKRMKRLRLKPNENILATLEETRRVIREWMVEDETRGSVPLSSREKRIKEERKLFLMEYKHWLKRSKVELKDHPWAHFGYQNNGHQLAEVSTAS